MELLRDAVTPMDCLILLASLYAVYATDFENATTIEYAYLAGFGLWFLLLLLRIYLIARKKGKVNS